MHFVIFDLDGTLTQTYYGNDNSYVLALSEQLPIDLNYKYWHDCPNLTDSAVLDHIYRKLLNRAPNADEIALMQQRFMARMEAKRAAMPEFFEEIPGAVRAIEHLLGRGDTLVGVATGGWEMLARYKLTHANFPLEKLHVVGSDNHHAKRDFVTALMQDVRAAQRVEAYSSVSYVGDSRYDYQTAKALGLGFVGVDYNNAGHLRETSAQHILPNYHDLELFEHALGL